MPIEFKDLVGGNGGGGFFRVLSVQSGQIAAGASGTILSKSIADVTGATVIRISHLLTSATTTESNVTFATDKGIMFAGAILSDTTPQAITQLTEFGIAKWTSSTGLGQGAKIFPHWYCESFTLSKPTATGASIDWVVEYGVIE